MSEPLEVPSTTTQHVLIVDDDPSMAKAIRRILDNAGYKTLVVNTGFEAGVFLGHHIPALMTLDLKMPGMDGREVLTCIRQTDYLKDIKILVVSGMPEEQLLESVGQGADDYLQKPFNSSELVDKVNRLVNGE